MYFHLKVGLWEQGHPDVSWRERSISASPGSRNSWDEVGTMGEHIPSWATWAETLGRLRCGLEVVNHVQSSRSIQAEKQREHLQAGAKS